MEAQPETTQRTVEVKESLLHLGETKDERAITYSWFNLATDSWAEDSTVTRPRLQPYYTIVIILRSCPEVVESNYNRLSFG